MKDFLRHLLHIGAVAAATTGALAAANGPLTSGHVLVPAGLAGLQAIIHATLGDSK